MPLPIAAFIGPNGGGKTLGAMELVVVPALKDGRDVVSNLVIRHKNARTLESWRELGSLHDCVLLLDEVSRVAPSRAAMSMPPQLYGLLDQLRKPDLEVVWTAPVWGRADSILRGVTQSVTVCRGYVKDFKSRERVIPPWYKPFAPVVAEGPRMLNRRWTPNSLFVYRTYDATQFEEYTAHTVKDVRPIEKAWLWRPWHEGQFLYDTKASVSMLDNISDIGVCTTCGGTRTRLKCRCPRSKEEDSADESGGASTDATGLDALVAVGADDE
jgi:hypothetical protein